MDVYEEIKEERKRQDGIWGGEEYDDQHSKGDWLTYINNYKEKARLEGKYRYCLVRLAALAVAAIESYDRDVKGSENGNV